MSSDLDDSSPRKAPILDIVIPRDLSRLSLEELEAMILTLEGEIGRLRKAIDAKVSTRSAADAIFRR